MRGLATGLVPELFADERPEPGQRIARPFGLDELVALVGLRVLEAVALEARHGQPQQRRPLPRPDMSHGLVDQPRRLLGIGAVAGQDVECRKLARFFAMSPPGVWKLDGTEMPY